jgi:cytochrome b561
MALHAAAGEGLMKIVTRYHPLLVALHWLIALLIIGLLGLGFCVLSDMPSSDPQKLPILQWHMMGGMIVLLLMIVRVITRLRSAHPVPAATGSPQLDRLAVVGHYGLYAIVFLMIASGWFTGFLISGSYAPHGPPLPNDFAALPSFQVHAILAVMLALLISGHVAAALWHQFGRKDGLLGRMAFGRREP